MLGSSSGGRSLTLHINEFSPRGTEAFKVLSFTSPDRRQKMLNSPERTFLEAQTMTASTPLEPITTDSECHLLDLLIVIISRTMCDLLSLLSNHKNTEPIVEILAEAEAHFSISPRTI
jgi:hypothetical protein